MKDYLLHQQESERLLFRKLTLDDFSDWMRFYDDPSSTNYLAPFNGSNEELCKYWLNMQIERYQKGNGLCALIEKKSKNLIGQCGMVAQMVNNIEEIEIGYHILPKYRKQGFASEAAIKSKEYCFENKLSKSIISIVHQENIISQKVAKNNGMELDIKAIFKNIPVNIFRVKAV